MTSSFALTPAAAAGSGSSSAPNAVDPNPNAVFGGSSSGGNKAETDRRRASTVGTGLSSYSGTSGAPTRARSSSYDSVGCSSSTLQQLAQHQQPSPVSRMTRLNPAQSLSGSFSLTKRLYSRWRYPVSLSDGTPSSCASAFSTLTNSSTFDVQLRKAMPSLAPESASCGTVGTGNPMSLPIPAMPLTALPASSAPLASGMSLAATRFVCSDCLLIVYGQGPCSPSELCFS
mmetsp:Transcript_5662/g.13057  ORF Transcript_5662/g.13057 Transcript_5662/m.13057 type:complete len:230 (-) Transcript_5662:2069-2758(-)